MAEMELPMELWGHLYAAGEATSDVDGTAPDQNTLVQSAIQQDLFPLLMAHQGGLLTEAIRAGYRVLERAFRRRYEASRDAACELTRITGPEAFLFYKGADYRHRLYAQPHWRTMNDIDVLLPRAQLARIKGPLASAGYVPRFSAYGDVFLPGYHETRYELPGSALDVHTSFGQRIRSGIDYDALWQRREWFAADGVAGFRVSHADAILVQAFNLAKDEFGSKLSRFLDFALLIRARPELLAECVERAKAWHIERALFGALYLQSRLFPSWFGPEAQAAMLQLLDPAQRDMLASHILPRLPEQLAGTHRGRMQQLRSKFGLIDQPWRRFAFVGYHLYAGAVGSVLGAPTWLRHTRKLRRQAR